MVIVDCGFVSLLEKKIGVMQTNCKDDMERNYKSEILIGRIKITK